jgi:hypothetical protein
MTVYNPRPQSFRLKKAYTGSRWGRRKASKNATQSRFAEATLPQSFLNTTPNTLKPKKIHQNFKKPYSTP